VPYALSSVATRGSREINRRRSLRWAVRACSDQLEAKRVVGQLGRGERSHPADGAISGPQRGADVARGHGTRAVGRARFPSATCSRIAPAVFERSPRRSALSLSLATPASGVPAAQERRRSIARRMACLLRVHSRNPLARPVPRQDLLRKPARSRSNRSSNRKTYDSPHSSSDSARVRMQGHESRHHPYEIQRLVFVVIDRGASQPEPEEVVLSELRA
jgi:hypothetical protein